MVRWTIRPSRTWFSFAHSATSPRPDPPNLAWTATEVRRRLTLLGRDETPGRERTCSEGIDAICCPAVLEDSPLMRCYCDGSSSTERAIISKIADHCMFPFSLRDKDTVTQKSKKRQHIEPWEKYSACPICQRSIPTTFLANHASTCMEAKAVPEDRSRAKRSKGRADEGRTIDRTMPLMSQQIPAGLVGDGPQEDSVSMGATHSAVAGNNNAFAVLMQVRQWCGRGNHAENSIESQNRGTDNCTPHCGFHLFVIHFRPSDRPRTSFSLSD